MQPVRRDLVRMLSIGVVAAVILTFIALQINWFPPQADTAAHKIDTLYDWLLVASVPIFVLVMTVAIYSVVRFRVRPGQEAGDGAPIHGHTRLEVFWVTIPFLIVTTLAVYAAVVLAQIEKKQPNEIQLAVTGQQFTWHFSYGNVGTNKPVTSDVLYLPKGRPVYVSIRSKDVIHSFWVPAFRLKIDAVPGQTTHVRFTPTRVGNYEVVCAELCGWGHSTMRVKALVVTPQRFQQFVQQKTAAAPAQPSGAQPSAPTAAAGKAIFTGVGGCGACHTLADAGTTGAVGPKLDAVVADAKKYGKGQSAQAYITQSIETPNAIVVPGFPASTMPQDFKTRLGPAKIAALVKYLLQAGGGK